MKCPHCEWEYTPVEGQKFCSRCGKGLELTETGFPGPEKEPGQSWQAPPHQELPDVELREDYCPWEDAESLGFGAALSSTIKESLFSPSVFFARMPVRGGFVSPLLFALIVGTLGTMLGYLWGFLFENPLLSQMKPLGAMALLGAILIPILVFLSVVVWAGILHVCVLLLGGAKEDFEATFRLVCYSTAPELFNVIPVIGTWIGVALKVYITVVAVREVHRTSTGKAVAAVVLPLLVCCGIFFALAVLIVAGIGAAGA